MTEKFSHKKGMYGHAGEDDGDFLKPGGVSPRDVAGDRGSDSDGYKRGEQSRGGSQAWESRRGTDDMEFLIPSQSQTMSRTPRVTRDVFNEVMQHGGEGPFGDGGSAVREIGGAGGKPRYASNAGRKPNDNEGL